MGVGTFIAASLGIIAVVFITDLGISRAQLGIIFAINTVGAAVLSPVIGRITDRIGGRASLIVVALTAAGSFLILGIAGSLITLAVGSAIGAVAQAGSNPATNKLIAGELPAGSQGIVTGVKQSGVQAFIFAGGLIVPSMALAWGRMSAYVMLAALSVLLAVAGAWLLPKPKTHSASEADAPNREPLPNAIWWITAYGFLLGFAGSATIMFALFTTEGLGQSIVMGGAVVAVVGVTAMPARIVWARHAERHHAYRSSLMIISLLGALAAFALIGAGSGVWWLIWVAAVLTGVGPSSWNSVGMLGLIVFAGPSAAGHASGVILLGFLVGLGIGPPLFGWMVDASGSYTGVWVSSLVAALAGTLVMAAWRPPDREVLAPVQP